MSDVQMLPQEMQERVDKIARRAFENGLWSMEGAMNFRKCCFTPETIRSWERTMDMAVRAKRRGGVKYINLDLPFFRRK